MGSFKLGLLTSLVRNKFANLLIKPKMEANTVLVPPKCVQNMKILDKKAFETIIKIPYVETTQCNIGLVTKVLKPFMLKMDNLKPVQNQDNSDHKIILLNPEKVTTLCKLNSEDRQHLSKYCVDIDKLRKKEITINYENWKADEILRAIIPANLPTISGYSLVGHILHLNLRNHHEDYKKIIGEVLLEKMSRIRTVVNKLNIIDSTYRNFQMELLAGEDDTVVKVKEHGVIFEFDFAKVYWNPRLSTEHTRIVDKLKFGDILFDVFSGVGPFSIPAAKKKCKVYANDLNPDSYKWLCHNVKLNKVNNVLETFNLNACDFITFKVGPALRELVQKEHNIHIVMNLPASGVEFLSSFKGLIPDLRVDNLNVHIHSYCFIKDATDPEVAKNLVEDNLGVKLDKEYIQEIVHVRNVAPNKEMIRVSFNLPKEVLINDCNNTNEPPIKKPKV